MPQFDVHFFSSLIFWELVSFGILLWVLYKFAFPPILDALETRERKIRDSIEQAEQNRLTAEQRLAEYEAKLRGAAREAEAVVAEAKAKVTGDVVPEDDDGSVAGELSNAFKTVEKLSLIHI